MFRMADMMARSLELVGTGNRTGNRIEHHGVRRELRDVAWFPQCRLKGHGAKHLKFHTHEDMLAETVSLDELLRRAISFYLIYSRD